MITVDEQIKKWLAEDADWINRRVAELTPSSRGRFLRSAVELATDGRRSRANLTKLLLIVQGILASSLPGIDPVEASKLLKELTRVLANSDAESNQQQIVIAVNLLLARIPSWSIALREPGIEILEHATRRKDKLARQFLGRERRKESRLVGGGRDVFGDLDIAIAMANVRVDVENDWYRDPWQWPELNWLSDRGHEHIVERLRSGESGDVVRVDVPKSGSSTRPASILDIVDRIAYQAIVDHLSPFLISDTPRWVYGWRLPRNGASDRGYLSNIKEWNEFRQQLKLCAEESSYGVHLDVREFFSSLDIDLLLTQLARKCRQSSLLDRLHVFYHAWRVRSGRSGIPQRCLASSVVAQGYLQPVDEVLDTIHRVTPGFRPLRWMDDIYLFSDDESRLRRIAHEIEASLEQLGLALNPEKTRFVELGDSDHEEILGLDLYGELESSDDPVKKMTEVFGEFLDHAEQFSRTDIRILLNRLRSVSKSVFQEVAAQFHDLSYAADMIARELLSTGQWQDHEEWYVNYAAKRFAPSDWSVAAWGEMFPPMPGGKTLAAECFSRKISEARQTILIPLASHRLSRWIGDSSINCLRDGAENASCPFELRAISLAATSSRVEKDEMKSWLSAFPENEVLLEALSEARFKRIPRSSRRSKRKR